MSFFNKKEEVLDVQLTQYGKYMLSKGKFKPVYYTFSDDEILYSTEYAESSKTETKKESSERIQKETQRLKNLYAYEGIETRVLKLNNHQILDKGSGFQSGKTGRVEKMPVGELYGFDYQDDIEMHHDQKNLVRNYIGHSTPGERFVPSWEIESLMGGDIKDVNISSSTPNIGIKRPVISMDVHYDITAKKFPESETEDVIEIEEYRTQTGLEKQIFFTDNTTVTIEDDALVLSVVEENVDYAKENFEIEMFVEETERIGQFFSILGGTFLPKYETSLRRLYFADDVEEAADKRYVQYYFDCLSDQDMADLYGIDIFGTQRDKLKNLVKKAIAAMQSGEFDEGEEDFIDDFEDIIDPCDDDGDDGFGDYE